MRISGPGEDGCSRSRTHSTLRKRLKLLPLGPRSGCVARKTATGTTSSGRFTHSASTGEEIRLFPGRHNRLQAQIVMEFGPRFAPGATLLYLEDAADKLLHQDRETGRAWRSDYRT